MHDDTWQNFVARNDHFVYVVSRYDVFDVRFCKPMLFCTRRFNFRLKTDKMQE